MYLIDMLAALAKEEKSKLDEEERKKSSNQEQLMLQTNPIQLPPMTNFKRKRSMKQEKMPAMTNERFDHQKVSDIVYKPELEQAEENTDHRHPEEEVQEEECKKVVSQRKKRKTNKTVENYGDDVDYGPKQKKKKKNNKKKDVVDFGSFNPPPDLPKEFKDKILIKANGGVVSKEVLIIQKMLKESDVKGQQNRFSIPVNQIMNTFLDPDEVEFFVRRDGKHCSTKEIEIFEPSGKVETVRLSKWVMKKEIGNPSISYVLKGNWKLVVRLNNLVEGDIVQLWAVRIREKLCLAFVVLNKKEEPENKKEKQEVLRRNVCNTSRDSCVVGDEKADEAKASSSLVVVAHQSEPDQTINEIQDSPLE